MSGPTLFDADVIATGTVDTARLGSGTADASSYLRGDQTWAAISVGVAWGAITGTLADQTDLQSALNAKAATSHTHVQANITDMTTASVVTFAGLVVNGPSGNTNIRLGHPTNASGVLSGWLSNTTQTIGIGFNAVGQYGGASGVASGRSLFVYDYSGGYYVYGIGPDGHLYYGASSTSWSARITKSAAGNVPFTARAAATPTANIFECQLVGGTVVASVSAAGGGAFTGPVSVGVYTLATVPTASASTGAIIRISDRAQRQAYSDGTNWRFTADDVIIS